MASNPRIDDLRKRLEKDPGSRLFAQLAEELRKAGDLDEAIDLSREGLQKHPAYPSARMTLGRALFDKGDLAGARVELEAVLKGAADNILASRLLAESLEGLGDVRGALDRYRQTLAIAPGDRQIASKASALEAKLESAARAAEAPLEPSPMAIEPEPPAPSAAPELAPPAALPLSELPGALPPDAPIPLVAADESFELERPYEAHAGGPASSAEPLLEPTVTAEPEAIFAPPPEPAVLPPVPEPAEVMAPPVAPPGPDYLEPPAPVHFAPPSPVTEAPPGELFEFADPEEISDAATLQAPAPTFEEPPVAPPLAPPVAPPEPPRPPAAAAAPQEPRMLPDMESEPPPPWVTPAAAAPAPEIVSSTLAELYFNQGFTDKAIEVYQQVIGREPGNERARTRLAELQQPATAPADRATAPLPVPGDVRGARRQAIERVIGRLESLRTTLRRG